MSVRFVVGLVFVVVGVIVAGALRRYVEGSILVSSGTVMMVF